MTSYCGAAPFPEDWLLRWNLDPALLAGLALAAFAASRATNRPAALGAVGVLALAFVSPLCALSVALFSARAVHHLLIVAAAAPLLALAFPRMRSIGLGPALLVATGVLWAWHVPALYDRALADSAVYWLMQATLLASATLYWRALFAAPPVPAMIAGIGGMAQMGMLGALLTFARTPLYAAHDGTTLPFGIGQVADQQLAGLIMWVPGIVPYAIAVMLIARHSWARAGAAA